LLAVAVVAVILVLAVAVVDLSKLRLEFLRQLLLSP
jgi:hypothetical protein